MIKIKNTLSYNKMRLDILSGNVTGIWDKNNFFMGSSSSPIMKYHYLTANFTNFEKHFSKKMPKISYHLSGYGVNFNETLVSFIGESIERYAFSLLPEIIKSKVILSSYSLLNEKMTNDIICDLKYVNSYYSMSEVNNYVKADDFIRWIPMNSLIYSDKKVWMPLQFVVMYTEQLFTDEKRYVTTAVSTGTACHEDELKSIENALIECLQIDSFNLWWYGGLEEKEINFDVEKNISLWFKNNISIPRFLNDFTVKFSDISYDKNIYVVLCEIEAKNDKSNLPKYTVGVQGGYDFEKSIYRAYMECMTVLEYNMNVSWTDKEKFISVGQDNKVIDNLDDNVIFYSKYGKPILLKKQNSMLSESIVNTKNLKGLLEKISEVSEYAAVLTVTPPEFKNINCEVSRVIVPELLPISLPSYPPYKHERYKSIGGVLNHLPHPIA